MSNYVLENEAEFERLEKQSQSEAYNYEIELSEFSPRAAGTILDAGCGSGVVSRYLAKKFPDSKVIGCDLSDQRVQQARFVAQNIPNLHFETGSVTQLPAGNSSMDAVVCRYVLEHLNEGDVNKAMNEFFRCLKPGGTLCAVDVDGFLFNVFPHTPLMSKVFNKFLTERPIDLNIGRKLPHLFSRAKFINVTWRIETLQFRSESLQKETQLLGERFIQAEEFLAKFLGDKSAARKFIEEYHECLRSRDAVLFYNKFIVQAEKPGMRRAE